VVFDHDEINPDELSRLAATARNEASSGLSEPINLRALHDRLIGPFEPLLEDLRNLTIVPDWVNQEVPFPALVDPAGRFLIQRRNPTGARPCPGSHR
jgi:hypothetical protein